MVGGVPSRFTSLRFTSTDRMSVAARSAAEQLEHDEHDDGQSEPAAEEPDEERPAGSAFFFVFLRGHGVILSAALRRTPARGRQEDVVQRWCHPGSYLAAVLAPRVR